MTLSPQKQIQEWIKKREFDRASEEINRRMIDDPENADFYYLKGLNEYFQGKIGPTLQHLRKALEIDPKHTDSAICLSVLYNDIGKYDEARLVFEQANHSVSIPHSRNDRGIDQKFSIKHLELADLYFRYRRYDESIQEYSKAIALDPSQLEIRIRLAKAYAKKGFISRAIQELQRMKTENSMYIPARLQLGLLHYSQGEILEAELEWESVLELDQKNREAKAYLEMIQQKSNMQSSNR